MTVPFRLTLGIEIEFVVAYPSALITNLGHLETGWFVRSQIVHALREAGLSVNEAGAATNYEHWTVGTDGSINIEPENPRSPHWSGFQFIPVELRSPVLSWDMNSTAFQHLNAVLRTLREKFHTFTNRSCGLHIHVGNGLLGFSYKTLKNLAYLVTVFERQLASMHPYHRVNNVHCRGPGSNFEGQNLIGKLLTIGSRNSTSSVINLMCSNTDGDKRGFAYNMANLLTDDEPPTIEFRQHEATLDYSAIAPWICLACGLVETCQKFNGQRMASLLSHGIGENAYSFLDLLTELGLKPIVEYYSQRTIHEHPQLIGKLRYEGEAWVSESQPSTASATVSPPVHLSIDMSGDEEVARRLAHGLRPRARGGARATRASELASKHLENLAADTDWDVQYALFDVLEECDQDDDEDMSYG